MNDGHNFYISGEFRKQQQILFADRGNQYTQTDFTSTGGLNLTLGVPNTLNGGIATRDWQLSLLQLLNRSPDRAFSRVSRGYLGAGLPVRCLGRLCFERIGRWMGAP